MSSFPKSMHRQKYFDEIDRLVGMAILNNHKRESVKFAFMNTLAKHERLTRDEWIYLAQQSCYEDDWAIFQYRKQESRAHYHGLLPIEIELKK